MLRKCYTAYATIDLIDSALAAGARRVIPKDFDNTELIDVVRAILHPRAS
ncbi:MAG: hypothetical protein O3C40_36730 [Planctomycetota bacterium]|nr:hypothetical protein [Planctomycetota bacterium]